MKQDIGVFTPEVLRRKLIAEKSRSKQLEIKNANERNLKSALREANLLCVQKVKWLGWVPEVTKDGKHMRNCDGSLCGSYMCGWLTEDNKIEDHMASRYR